jgi:DNA invertase Pin-like site-specific DNA recombinase
MKNAAGYVRVSTAEQAKKGISIAQRCFEKYHCYLNLSPP